MSSSAHATARAHKHLVQSPGGRAPAHCIKPLWVRTAQSPFGLEPYSTEAQSPSGLAPYRRTQKHKALVGLHRTDVQARSFAHVRARAHKHLVQSFGGRAPAHSMKLLWVRTTQSPCGIAPYRRTQKHKALVGSHHTDVQARSFAHVPHEHRTPWYKARGDEDHTEVLTLAHDELLCTRFHTRAQRTQPHSHMLPPTSRIGPTQEHCTGTRSCIALGYCTKRSWARTVQKPHTHTHELMYARPLLDPIYTRVLHEARGCIPQKNTCCRTRAILVSCTGPVRSAGSSTHVSPNEALFHAHMLGTREHTRTLTAVDAGFYSSRARPVHAHKPTHEFRTRSEACI